MVNSHVGVVVFAGDFDDDHPDPMRRGSGPMLTLIATGTEAFCWDALTRWTQTHPLQRDESVEVLTRDPIVVAADDVLAEG